MKRFSFLAALLVAALASLLGLGLSGYVNASSNAGGACGCADCQCPDCDGVSCSCDVCDCGSCGCGENASSSAHARKSCAVVSTKQSRAACGCEVCKCPDCDGQVCSCDSCDCVGCACAR